MLAVSVIEALDRVIGIPLGIFHLFGGIVAGIWLAILGEWKVIGLGLLLLVSSPFLLGFVLMPGSMFAIPAMKAVESGRKMLGALMGSLSVIYTTAVIVVWAYLMLRFFHGRAHDSSQIPFLLWSYGGPVFGPYAYLAKNGDTRNEIRATSVAHIVESWAKSLE